MVSQPDTNRSEFTKCILKSGTANKVCDEGQWLKASIKKKFNSNLVTSHGHQIDSLLGFKLNPDDEIFTPVRLRLGYYDTYLGKIVHGAIQEMKEGELAHISFELDPRMLDESLATKSASDQVVFIDFKFEIRLDEIEDQVLPIYKLGNIRLIESLIDLDKPWI